MIIITRKIRRTRGLIVRHHGHDILCDLAIRDTTGAVGTCATVKTTVLQDANVIDDNPCELYYILCVCRRIDNRKRDRYEEPYYNIIKIARRFLYVTRHNPAI